MNIRTFLFIVCALQIISTVIRLVFDFLGYLLTPIITNFVHLIFLVIGIFASYQLRKKCAFIFMLWQFIWMGWSLFIICYYLEIGILHREYTILINLGTGHKSWWQEHGIGCKINGTSAVSFGQYQVAPMDDQVTQCLLAYYWVEVIQAAVQIFLALLALIGAICLLCWLRSGSNESEPVKNELEFIKMRYKSPARIVHQSTENSQFNTLATTLPSLSFDNLNVNFDNDFAQSNERRRDQPATCLPPPSRLSAITLLEQQREADDGEFQQLSLPPPMLHKKHRFSHKRDTLNRSTNSGEHSEARSEQLSLRSSHLRDSLPWVQVHGHQTSRWPPLLRSDSNMTDQLPPYTPNNAPHIKLPASGETETDGDVFYNVLRNTPSPKKPNESSTQQFNTSCHRFTSSPTPTYVNRPLPPRYSALAPPGHILSSKNNPADSNKATNFFEAKNSIIV